MDLDAVRALGDMCTGDGDKLLHPRVQRAIGKHPVTESPEGVLNLWRKRLALFGNGARLTRIHLAWHG
jgi:hypothetical protein